MPKENSYVAFYTTRPFWVGKMPDIEQISKSETTFREALSEVVEEYENDDIYLGFCKDGMIMTRFHSIENDPQLADDYFKRTSSYLKLLNTIQLLLDTALLKTENLSYFKVSVIRPGEAFRINFKGSKFSSSGVPNNITSTFYSGRFLTDYRRPIQIDSRIARRHEIKSEVFELCFENLKSAIKNKETVDILSQINTAVSEFNSINFAQSLIQSWFCIEYFMFRKWVRYLSVNKDNLNSASKKILTKEITSAQLSSFLKLNGHITNKDFNSITSLRKKRNDIVHRNELKSVELQSLKENSTKKKKMVQVEDKDCYKAFDILTSFVNDEFGIQLKIDGGYGFNSL